MSSRKGKCPGCKTLKAPHQFGSPGKNCPGPTEDPVDGTEHDEYTSDEPSPSVLLAAIRSLSSQMETMQLQHDALKKQVKEAKQAEISSQSSETSAQDTQPTTPPLAGISASNIPEKTAQASAKGEYIDFSDLLSTLSVP